MSEPYKKHNGHPSRVGHATHHIFVDPERLILARAPVAGAPPELDEIGAGAQCAGCGRDIFDVLQWDAGRELLVCDCGARYGLREGGYLSERPREDGGDQ